MSLTDVATTDVVTARTDTEVRDILEMMDDEHVGSVIVEADNEPIGIVTDRMIAMAMREHDSIEDMTAEDLMTEDPITASEDHTHFEALELMRDEAIRRLPIVDDDGTLTGIITLDDMLMLTAAELSNASDVIEQQTSPS